jgi:CO/xanthine dehydrogenase Mo-binding subunit
MSSADLSRRQLIEGAAGLVVGFALGGVGASVSAAESVTGRSVEPESLDSWLAITRDGTVTLYTGRVDLGTGTQTVFAQFVAEELDVPVERVRVVMGDTRLTPDQGKTTASLNVVRGSQPVRVAAAEARAVLMRLAADKLGIAVSDLKAENGQILPRSASTGNLSYGELIGDRNFSVTLEAVGKSAEDISRGVMLKPKAPLKAFKDYKVVGQSIPRIDIPAKVTGHHEYVQNVRVPGMLHGRVVRPPEIGAKLVSVDDGSVRHIPGVQIVRRNDFLGVVAPREEDAIKAARALRAEWTRSQPLPEFDRIYEELPKHKVVRDEPGYNKGDIAAGLAKGKTRLKATYDFPFQDHAMIGPSCAVADVTSQRALIWSGSQWPQGDRSDIAKMLGLPLERVQLIWREASGSYGRLGCDDAAADAAIMSQIVGRPVRVQWMRHDEHGWEPISPAMTMTVEGAADASGRVIAFDYVQYSPSHSMGEKGNHLAWHLIGGAPGWGRMSGAAANLWYDVEAKRARNIYVEPWLRGIYLRSPGGIQSIFAYESFIDELAAACGVDPLQFRLDNTPDARDRDVLQAVAQLSGWQPRKSPGGRADNAATLKGRGLAMGRYGAGESRSAVVVDVEIDRASGRVTLAQACIAFDCGLVLNPDGLINQVEGGLLQGLSRALHEEVRFDRGKVTSLDWKDYRILTFAELPKVKTQLIARPDQAWGSAGEAGTVATAAALGNAVFDATGRHPRRLPLVPDRVKALM